MYNWRGLHLSLVTLFAFPRGCVEVVAKTRGTGSGRVGVSFFSNYFCFNFCRYSPVLLFSNNRHLSLIYGGD